MTISFFAPDGVELSATQFRQTHAAQYGGGANRPLGGRSGFRVDTASDVFTATSTTWTLKPSSAMIDPGALTHQGMYGWATSENVTGSVDAADATLTRYDRVWIRLNDSTAGDVSGAVSANLEYQAGTAGAGVPIAVPNRCFLVADITVPPAGGGSPTVQVNPARFAAAGAPLPVYSQTERDALIEYDGLTVQRRDLAGRPLQTWNGSEWRSSVEFGPVNTAADSNWAYTGQLVREPAPDGTSCVQLGERLSRSSPTGFTISTTYITLITGFIPAGWRPAATVNGMTVMTDGADVAAGVMWWQITTAGTLRARLDSGSTTFAQNWRIHLSGNWTTT